VPGELERAETLAGEITRMCIDLGGSITGEHGVGMEKRQHMPPCSRRPDLQVMAELRRAPSTLANCQPRQNVPCGRGAGAAQPRPAPARAAGRHFARIAATYA
jgi:glycolate oxidase